MRPWLGVAIAAGVLVLACRPSTVSRTDTAVPAHDSRPIYAEAALPGPGAPVPPFDVSRLGGGRVSAESLRGQPVMLALWSTGCPRSREAVAVLDSLHRRHAPRGVRTVLLADDADSALVRAVLQRAGLPIADGSGAETGVIVGLTRGQLTSLFDQSAAARTDPALRAYHIAFVAPGFLLIDSGGTIRRRAAILLHSRVFGAALDSMVAPD